MSPDRDPRGKVEELASVVAGQIRDRYDLAFAPQDVVGKAGMSLMWMPPQTTWPPLDSIASAAGTSVPTGAKMITASSSENGVSSEPPAQVAPI